MSLVFGTRLGPYEIVAPLGAGGMGEVYRAKDTRLGREVAIKVLPARLTADREARERLQREAKSISALNHPNVCTLYDVGHEAGTDFLVMEFVDGESLDARLRRAHRPDGAPGLQPRGIPADEALPIARQIALALEAAHERGIIHRDLKPSNIKVTPDGHVKVLDFGLAKAFGFPGAEAPGLHGNEAPALHGDGGGAASDAANSPTVTALAATQAGVILGTAAYMSPEQARGRIVDKRTDIWAFGCVLYELLTGRQAFSGETVTDVLAAIVTKAPDWTALPADTPATVRKVLGRCLEKDPRQRRRDIADVRLDLDEDAGDVTAGEPPATIARRVSPAVAAVIALVGIAAIGGAYLAGRSARTPVVVDGSGWHAELLGGSTIAFQPIPSPDGRRVAFQAMVDNLTQVAVMNPVSGMWTRLTSDRSRGNIANMAWSNDGSRIFYDRFTSVPRGVFSVSEVGGGDERPVLPDAMAPRVLPDDSLLVVLINTDRQWQLHRFWPTADRLEPLPALVYEGVFALGLAAFPDGREAVYLGRPAGVPDAEHGLWCIDLTSGRSRPLVTIEADSRDWLFPLTVIPGRDGQRDRVVFDRPAGSLRRIVALPRDGAGPMETLFTMSSRPQTLAAGADGGLYTDVHGMTVQILRYSPATGQSTLTDVSAASFGNYPLLPLADGRTLVAVGHGSDRKRVMVHAPGRDFVPFIDTAEDTSSPMAPIGDDRIALFLGSGPNRALHIVSAVDGRILRKLDMREDVNIDSVAGTADGRTLYYTAGGDVWALGLDGSEPPRKVHPGDDVAIDRKGGYLVIQLTEAEDRRLIRFQLPDGPPLTLPITGSYRPAPRGLGPLAIGADGRVALRLATHDSWYWPAGILHPSTGHVQVVPPGATIDMAAPAWTHDGAIVTKTNTTTSTLWRLRPVGASTGR